MAKKKTRAKAEETPIRVRIESEPNHDRTTEWLRWLIERGRAHRAEKLRNISRDPSGE